MAARERERGCVLRSEFLPWLFVCAHLNVLPLGSSSGEDKTLPEVVLSGQARGLEVDNEPPTISPHTQLQCIKF